MNNVDDLKKTNEIIHGEQTQQTISLSALTGGEKEATPSISINTTNGLSGIEEPEQNRSTIRINPNRKKSTRRTIESPEDLKEIDPGDYIAEKPSVAPKTFKDVALDQLDAAVKRKQDEYKAFVEYASERDKEHRENIENGLESIADEEVQYMPNDLYTPIDDSDKVKTTEDEDLYENRLIDDPEDEYDDFDEKDALDYNEEKIDSNIVPNSVTIDNDPFSLDEDEEVQYMPNDLTPIDDSDKVKTTEDEDLYENRLINDPEDEVEEDIDETVRKDITQGSFNMTSSALATEPDTSDFEIDEEDFEDLDTSESYNDELTEEESNAIYEAAEKNLKSEILRKIIQTGKKLDTTQFKVSTKVVNIKDALKGSEKKVQRTATWPMMFAGRPFKASALKGPEIALLADADDSDSDTSVGITMDQAKIMFEHDANPYRPSTLEAWAKTIPIYDVESIFAALYVASFKGSNYMPMACSKPKCQNAFLTDNIDIDSMVKFENDDIKKRFDEINKTELTPENTGAYESVVNVINDKFAIGLKIPSIYTMLFEYSSLTSEFVRKYSTMVSIIHYIDYIYLIDPETSEFRPIGWKAYPGDNGKTFKSKIATYSKILQELDSTDFSILMALINTMVNKATESKYLSYEIPGCKCPKCGSDIPARPIYPRGLVFTRQRLVELATTPTEK